MSKKTPEDAKLAGYYFPLTAAQRFNLNAAPNGELRNGVYLPHVAALQFAGDYTMSKVHYSNSVHLQQIVIHLESKLRMCQLTGSGKVCRMCDAAAVLSSLTPSLWHESSMHARFTRSSVVQKKLNFTFKSVSVKLGPLKLGPFNIGGKGDDDSKSSFFIFFYADDEIICAQGKGGGIAFWRKAELDFVLKKGLNV